MNELEICAESEDKANEIAQNILESDARTHLIHGCFIADFETDLIEKMLMKKKQKFRLETKLSWYDWR